MSKQGPSMLIYCRHELLKVWPLMAVGLDLDVDLSEIKPKPRKRVCRHTNPLSRTQTCPANLSCQSWKISPPLCPLHFTETWMTHGVIPVMSHRWTRCNLNTELLAVRCHPYYAGGFLFHGFKDFYLPFVHYPSSLVTLEFCESYWSLVRWLERSTPL